MLYAGELEYEPEKGVIMCLGTCLTTCFSRNSIEDRLLRSHYEGPTCSDDVLHSPIAPCARWNNHSGHYTPSAEDHVRVQLDPATFVAYDE